MSESKQEKNTNTRVSVEIESQNKSEDNSLESAKKTAKSIVAKILGEARYREKTTDELDKLEEEVDNYKNNSNNTENSKINKKSEYDLNLKGEDQVKGGWTNIGRNLKNTWRATWEFGVRSNEDENLILEAIAPDIDSKLDNYIDNLFAENKDDGKSERSLDSFVDELDSELDKASEHGGLDRIQKLQLRSALDVVLNIKRETQVFAVDREQKLTSYKVVNKIQNADRYLQNLEDLNKELTAEDYKKVAEDIKFDVRNKATKSLIRSLSKLVVGVGTYWTGGLGWGGAIALGSIAEASAKTWSVEKKSNAMMERDKKRLMEKNYTDILLDRDLSGIEQQLNNLDRGNIKPSKELEDKLKKIDKASLIDEEKNKRKSNFTWVIDRLNDGAEIISAEDLAKKRDEFKKKIIAENKGVWDNKVKEKFKLGWKEASNNYVPLESAEQVLRKGLLQVDGKDPYQKDSEEVFNDKDSILAQSKKALVEFRKSNTEKYLVDPSNKDNILSYEQYEEEKTKLKRDIEAENDEDEKRKLQGELAKLTEYQLVRELKGEYKDTPAYKNLQEYHKQIKKLSKDLKQGSDKKNSFKDIRLIRLLNEQIKQYDSLGITQELNTDISSEDQSTTINQKQSIEEKIKEKKNKHNQEISKYEKILDYKKNEKVLNWGNRAKSIAWHSAMASIGNKLAYLGGANFGQGAGLNKVAEGLGKVVKEQVKVVGDNLQIAEHIKEKVLGSLEAINPLSPSANFEGRIGKIIDKSLTTDLFSQKTPEIPASFSESFKDKLNGASEYVVSEIKKLFRMKSVDLGAIGDDKFWVSSFKIRGENQWVSAYVDSSTPRTVDFVKNIGADGFSIKDILESKAGELLVRGRILGIASLFPVPESMKASLKGSKKQKEQKKEVTEGKDNNNIVVKNKNGSEVKSEKVEKTSSDSASSESDQTNVQATQPIEVVNNADNSLNETETQESEKLFQLEKGKKYAFSNQKTWGTFDVKDNEVVWSFTNRNNVYIEYKFNNDKDTYNAFILRDGTTNSQEERVNITFTFSGFDKYDIKLVIKTDNKDLLDASNLELEVIDEELDQEVKKDDKLDNTETESTKEQESEAELQKESEVEEEVVINKNEEVKINENQESESFKKLEFELESDREYRIKLLNVIIFKTKDNKVVFKHSSFADGNQTFGIGEPKQIELLNSETEKYTFKVDILKVADEKINLVLIPIDKKSAQILSQSNKQSRKKNRKESQEYETTINSENLDIEVDGATESMTTGVSVEDNQNPDTEEQENKEYYVREIFNSLKDLEDNYYKFLGKMEEYVVDNPTHNNLSDTLSKDYIPKFKKISQDILNNELFGLSRENLLDIEISILDLEDINDDIKRIIEHQGIITDLFNSFDRLKESFHDSRSNDFNQMLDFFEENTVKYKEKINNIGKILEAIKAGISDDLWETPDEN